MAKLLLVGRHFKLFKIVGWVVENRKGVFFRNTLLTVRTYKYLPAILSIFLLSVFLKISQKRIKKGRPK